MNKKVLILFLVALPIFLSISQNSKAQNIGVSFSFFFPRNGDFSVPISPFSYRGLGVDFGRFFALETGGTLYRMSGFGVTDLPFETNQSLFGPTITILVPLELVFRVGNNRQEFSLKGGVFGFYNFTNEIKEGNLDRALREELNWSVLNSNFTYDNKPGWGYDVGAEYIIYVTDQFGLTFAVNYLFGGSEVNLRGTYAGVNESGEVDSGSADFQGSKLDFTGWEITLGALFGN